jgi:hypothetical protein
VALRMPRLRPKTKRPEPVPFQFEYVVCFEAYSGWNGIVRRGDILARDHPQVRQYPAYWRLIGPPVNADGEVNDAA